VTETQEAPPVAATPARGPDPGWRRWLAVGTGVGIEVGIDQLRVCIVRVRPSGTEILDTLVIAGYASRPAAEWGAEYAAFLKRNGVGRRPAVMLLPRGEMVVRQLSFPGVEEGDLESAISFQVDSLHPWVEQEVAWSWARLGNSSHVVVGITRSEVLERFWTMLVEAGIKVSSFTFSAAALYSASRMIAAPPRDFLMLRQTDGWLEAYGESSGRPLFTGVFESSPAGIVPRLFSELRLDPQSEPIGASSLLPVPRRVPEGFVFEEWTSAMAAAMAAACPRLSLRANLLPVDRRAQTSRLVYVPSIVFGVLLIAIAIVALVQQGWEDQRFLAGLQQEIRTLERQAAAVALYDNQAGATTRKMALIDRYRSRTKADIDALQEVTALVAPPAWVQALQMTRINVTIQGEAETTSDLLRVLDESPLFRESHFAQALTKLNGGTESFVIRSARDGQGTGVEPGGEQ
jgi:hypothetical protein